MDVQITCLSTVGIMVNGNCASVVVALMVDPAMIDPKLRCLLHLREICRQLIIPGERELASLQGLL